MLHQSVEDDQQLLAEVLVQGECDVDLVALTRGRAACDVHTLRLHDLAGLADIEGWGS